MDTPSSELACKNELEILHTPSCAMSNNESWGLWRQVGWPFCVYCTVPLIHFGRCPFLVLSHTALPIKTVQMDLDCGLY